MSKEKNSVNTLIQIIKEITCLRDNVVEKKQELINQLKQLIREGADVNEVDSQGNTPLHIAISLYSKTLQSRDTPEETVKALEEVVKLLLEKGAKVDVFNTYDITPLGRLIEKMFHPDSLRALQGPVILEKSGSMAKLMIEKLESDKLKSVPRLVDSLQEYLFCAICGISSIPQHIVGDRMIQDTSNSGTILRFDFVIRDNMIKNAKEVISLILDKAQYISPQNSDKLVELLVKDRNLLSLKESIPYEQKDNFISKLIKRSVLSIEDEYSTIGCLEDLIPDEQIEKLTPIISEVKQDLLHPAVQQGRLELVQKLIDLGTNVHYANFRGLTALHIAVKENNGQMVDLLLNNGASPSVRHLFQQTPLDLAKELGRQGIEAQLLRSKTLIGWALDRIINIPLDILYTYHGRRIKQTEINNKYLDTIDKPSISNNAQNLNSVVKR